MQELDSQIIDLIISYLSGNASSEEIAELEGWVLADPANQASFKEFKKAWLMTGMRASQAEVNVEANLESVSSQLFVDSKVVPLKRKANLSLWLGVAAAVVLLLTLSLWFFNQPIQMEFMAEQKMEAIKLEDGSQINLNKGAELAYTFDEESGVRKVSLKGDAFFDVERDEEHPFIIEARSLQIEVLGTSFYVDTRQGVEWQTVTVESGKVAVRYGKQEVILTANEKAVLDVKQDTLTKDLNIDPNFNSIKTGKIVFDNTPIEEVVSTLSRHYGVKFELNLRKTKLCVMNGTFTNKSLKQVLDGLVATLEIEGKLEGEKVILEGDCTP
ncbi:MAG: FecR domain-containing protein [Bacteroidota bacterium]